jgi:hypothetical protein
MTSSATWEETLYVTDTTCNFLTSEPNLSWNHLMNGPGIPPNAWNSRLVSSTTHAPPASCAPCIALFFATASVFISMTNEQAKWWCGRKFNYIYSIRTNIRDGKFLPCISGRSTSRILKFIKLSPSNEVAAFFERIILISRCFIAFPVCRKMQTIIVSCELSDKSLVLPPPMRITHNKCNI